MKKILPLLILSFSTNQFSYAQGNIDSTSTWTIASIFNTDWWANVSYKVCEDTMINSIIYKTVYSTNDSVFDPSNSIYFCAVRESNNKWYIVHKQSITEYQLYDFNAELGDTVSTYNMSLGTVELIVFNVDSVLLNGVYYKRLMLGVYNAFGNPYWQEYWIEGIGSKNGFYNPAEHVFDAGTSLLCFHRHDSLIYINSPNGRCGYISYTGIKPVNKIGELRLIPNPVDNSLLVISDSSYFVEIFNAVGNLVLKSDKKIIDVSQLAKGFYIVNLYDDKMNLIKSEKIIKN